MLNKLVKTKDLYASQPEYLTELFESCEYPWEMLPKLKGYIQALIEKGIPGYTLYADGVLVGENVKIYPTATIEGPTIIGSGTEVRPGLLSAVALSPAKVVLWEILPSLRTACFWIRYRYRIITTSATLSWVTKPTPVQAPFVPT